MLVAHQVGKDVTLELARLLGCSRSLPAFSLRGDALKRAAVGVLWHRRFAVEVGYLRVVIHCIFSLLTDSFLALGVCGPWLLSVKTKLSAVNFLEHPKVRERLLHPAF